jgi:hypothetical protein
MSKQLTANPVRAVILRSAIGALADDDELHVDPLMRGLTADWLPGDAGSSHRLLMKTSARRAPAMRRSCACALIRPLRHGELSVSSGGLKTNHLRVLGSI